MSHEEAHQPDYGTGQKKLSIYIAGIIVCAALTVISFWAVMSNSFTKSETFAIIYISACIQFLVQVICFLRLNTKTEPGRTNVISFVFTGVILLCIVIGSVWIMSNLSYNLMG